MVFLNQQKKYGFYSEKKKTQRKCTIREFTFISYSCQMFDEFFSGN